MAIGKYPDARGALEASPSLAHVPHGASQSCTGPEPKLPMDLRVPYTCRCEVVLPPSQRVILSCYVRAVRQDPAAAALGQRDIDESRRIAKHLIEYPRHILGRYILQALRAHDPIKASGRRRHRR